MTAYPTIRSPALRLASNRSSRRMTTPYRCQRTAWIAGRLSSENSRSAGFAAPLATGVLDSKQSDRKASTSRRHPIGHTHLRELIGHTTIEGVPIELRSQKTARCGERQFG